MIVLPVVLLLLANLLPKVFCHSNLVPEVAEGKLPNSGPFIDFLPTVKLSLASLFIKLFLLLISTEFEPLNLVLMVYCINNCTTAAN